MIETTVDAAEALLAEIERREQDRRTEDSMCAECGEHVSNQAHDPDEMIRHEAPKMLRALKEIHHLTFTPGWIESLMRIRDIAAAATSEIEKREKAEAEK